MILKQQVGEPAHVGRLNRFFAPRHLLVMAQIALSLTLLFSAGLVLPRRAQGRRAESGFDRHGAISAEMDFTLGPWRGSGGAADHVCRGRIGVAALPGVRAAALTTMLPYGNITNARRVMRLDEAAVAKSDPNAPEPGASGYVYRRDSGLVRRDRRSHSCAVAISRDRVRKTRTPPLCLDHRRGDGEKAFSRIRTPLGQHIRYTLPPSDGSPNDFTIVGIVSAHRHEVLDSEMPTPDLRPARPGLQRWRHSSGAAGARTIVLRSAAMIPTAASGAARSRSDDAGPADRAVSKISWRRTLGSGRSGSRAILFGIFGGIALATSQSSAFMA